MEIQLWKELLDPYEQAVSELLQKFHNLKEEHRKKNLYSPIESVRGRVKTVASILEKMQRKNIPFESLEEALEDIAGIRIICQFVEDIEKVAVVFIDLVIVPSTRVHSSFFSFGGIPQVLHLHSTELFVNFPVMRAAAANRLARTAMTVR